jgi:hypothetical protein
MPELRMNAAISLLLPHTFMESMGTPLILHIQNGQYKNDTTGHPILVIGNNTLSSKNISLLQKNIKKKNLQSHGKINFVTVTESNIWRDYVKTCHLKDN